MKKLVFIGCVVCLMATGCTNSKDARNALSAQGFTDVRITGYNFFGCGKDDFYHTGFVAKSQSGQTIDGTVCSGIFKGATIRY